jgi:NAD(P)-dependent dehydrogenase (short-subunit alcohol dehydrogenase family)
MSLEGAVVIVTGASSGIGQATARALSARGAHPVLAARRADRLATLSAELGNALSLQTDVTVPEDIRALIDTTLSTYGRIDGLVNNAGVSLHHTIEGLDLARFAEVLDLNVVGVVALMQAVLPAMKRQHFGRIVNISSGTTRMALPGVGAYAASKAAVNMLSDVARKEFAPDGILVSVVLPSITATEFGGGIFQAGQSVRPGMTAHQPSYVAGVILRALQTGEARIDIPHGDEQAELTAVPSSVR